MKKFIYTMILGLTITNTYAAGSGDHKHEHKQGEGMFAVGQPAKGTIDRRVEVSMLDTMRFVFNPPLESLKEGESIEFVVRNDGNIKHEFSIGNMAEQKAHAQMMLAMPDMHHADPNTVSLEPGETATLPWQFMGKDTVVFACNIPGHFQAGMRHDLKISAQ